MFLFKKPVDWVFGLVGGEISLPKKDGFVFFQEQLWNAVLVNGGDEEVLLLLVLLGPGRKGGFDGLVRGDLLGLFNHFFGFIIPIYW